MTQPEAEDAGVLATWRGAPVAVRALLAGVLVQRLGGFGEVSWCCS